jgi:hypothetical protein
MCGIVKNDNTLTATLEYTDSGMELLTKYSSRT